MAEAEYGRVAAANADYEDRVKTMDAENRALKSALFVFQHQCTPAYQLQVTTSGAAGVRAFSACPHSRRVPLCVVIMAACCLGILGFPD